MRRVWLAVLALAMAVGCKPKPKPPAGGDSISVVDTMDSVGTDSTLIDQYTYPVEEELTAEDTVRSPADLKFIEGRKKLRSASRAGIPVGATQYPPDRWCTPNINATSSNSAPGVVASYVRKASDCGISVLIVPPRRLFTANGQSQGPFVKAKYLAMIDDYAKVLTPSFVAQYGPKGNHTIIGFQVFDDSKCNTCWGSPGVIIPSSTVAELARYAKQKMPYIPRTLRIEPSLLLDYRGWQVGDFDASSEQWTCKKRPPKMPITCSVAQEKAWFNYQDSLARFVTKNPWHIRQVSVGDIYPPDGPPITVQQLRDFKITAITYKPENNCASVSWMWENFFMNGGFPAAWFDISAMAKTIPWKSCAGASPVASGDSIPDSTIASDTDSVAVVAAETSKFIPPGHRKKH